MLIVEGPDGAGKTTLIASIQNYLGWPVAPRVVSKDMKAMGDLVNWVEENVAEGFQDKIFDRHRLISGPIYSTVMKAKPDEGFEDFRWLHLMQYRLLQQVAPVIIWCMPAYATVKANILADPDNKTLFTEVEMRQIYWLYHQRAALEPVPLMYDYEHDPISGVLEMIDVELEKR